MKKSTITEEYIYKLQGNGKDSWIVIVRDDGVEINRYVTLENPDLEISVEKDKKISRKIDLIYLFKHLTNQEKQQLKTFLNNL